MVKEMKYLYGAAVQGIQGFIFQTNKLRDIIGASELVEEICKETFSDFVGESDELILQAAGNIKCIFSDRVKCEKAVLEFPRIVQLKAPGITLSQAVVPYQHGEDFSIAVEELEKRLRIQRNCPGRSMTVGFMGTLRTRTTGLPSVKMNGTEYIDAGTETKQEVYNRNKSTSSLCAKCFGTHFDDCHIAYDIEKMTGINDWIAIIHADGNGLGQVVQMVGKDKDDFKHFSKDLNDATIAASRKAFKYIAANYLCNNFILRPVVLGGDDLTIICRGDIAVDYASHFLRYFEEETEVHLSSLLSKYKIFGINHLTACAGIAFIKSSYPFYYGYQLAEALCEESKKEAKSKCFKEANYGLSPSCLMFHKVQDSFVENYSKIEQRELSPNKDVSWKFGPYYIDERIARLLDRWTVYDLLDNVNAEFEGREGNAIKSHLRQWMSLMHDNPEVAQQKKERIINWAPGHQATFIENIALKPHHRAEKSVDVYPVYDLLALHSIMYKNTKAKEVNNGDN